MSNSIINKLLKLSIYDVNKISKRISNLVIQSPLEKNERLSKLYNANIFLKREDLQKTRSFKIRGSYNKILNIYNNNLSKVFPEIICASAGNHAQGVALSCNHLNLPCTIFIPSKTPLQKINRIKHFGNNQCTIKLTNDGFNECLDEALLYSNNMNSVFVHPYNDYDVICGQSTIAYEIFDKIQPDIILSGIGGGGLISGISLYKHEFCKVNNTKCKIIGIEPETCPSMKLSILNDNIIDCFVTDNFVDGATVSKVGDITYSICKKHIDDIYTVNIGKICETILDLYTEDGIISEPAGSLSISALDMLNKNDIKGKNIVCILSGGNNDISRYPEIRDRYLSYMGLKHYYLIQFAQKPGELKTFINDILGPNDDIVRFEYIKKTNIKYGNVLIGLELEKIENNIIIEEKLQQFGIQYLKLNEEHILYNYLI